MNVRGAEMSADVANADGTGLLVLSLDYPPNDGGISRLVASTVKALGARGVRCRVVTHPEAGRIGPMRPVGDVVEVSAHKARRDLGLFFEVRRYLKANGSNAPILASVWNPEATIALLAGAKRLTILAHGNEVMPYPRGRLKKCLRRAVLTRAWSVVCNSRFTEALVEAVAPGSTTCVINPAVDAVPAAAMTDKGEARRLLAMPKDARIVLTVARLDPIKGHDTVLRAIARMAPDERAGLRYVIVGRGWMEGNLRSLANELGIAEHVHFAGFVADSDLPLWYRAADLFVLASIVDDQRNGMEGFGMALTEAQSFGLPVIATRSGGIPDAVKEGKGGWLINERDDVALSEHLRRLIAAPEVFADQGQHGAARMGRELSWHGYAASLLELM